MTDAAAFWNNIADRYAQKPVDDPDAFDRKIAVTRSCITPQDVVLDIGCGTGSLALRLASTGAQLHGLDISQEMIRHARAKTAKQQADNVTFHVGPFDDSFTAFAPGSLDGICAYSLLHLVEDRPATLRRIHALLRPGGFFISSTVCMGGSWVPYAPILAVMRALGKAPPVVRVFSPATLEAELRDAGFVDLEAPEVGAKPPVTFRLARKPRG